MKKPILFGVAGRYSAYSAAAPSPPMPSTTAIPASWLPMASGPRPQIQRLTGSSDMSMGGSAPGWEC